MSQRASLESMNFFHLASHKKFRDRLGKIGNNTYARYDMQNQTASVFLHGNLIASCEYVNLDYSFADPEIAFGTKILTVSDAGWNTAITRDRINAFLKDNNVPFRSGTLRNVPLLMPQYEFIPENSIWENVRGINKAKFVYLSDTAEWVNVDFVSVP